MKAQLHNLLVHIGFSKTGTTWLQNNFFNNSALGFFRPFHGAEIGRPLSLPHALDFEPPTCREYFEPALFEVQRNGLLPVLSYERLAGNPHSGGYDSKELADRVAAVFPEARVLMVIREQKNIIMSAYKQYVWVTGTLSLTDYVCPPRYGMFRTPMFDWEQFKFHRLIRYYQRLFGKSRVLVLPYELFEEEPVIYLSKIMRFAGLEINWEVIKELPHFMKEHQSLSAFSVALKRRLNLIVGTNDRLTPHVLFPINHVQRNKLGKYWRTFDKVVPSMFKEAFEQRLKTTLFKLVGDRYTKSNIITSEMLNINLTEYGYDI